MFHFILISLFKYLRFAQKPFNIINNLNKNITSHIENISAKRQNQSSHESKTNKTKKKYKFKAIKPTMDQKEQ